MGTGVGDTQLAAIQVPIFERWTGDRHGSDYLTYLQMRLRRSDRERAKIMSEIRRVTSLNTPSQEQS